MKPIIKNAWRAFVKWWRVHWFAFWLGCVVSTLWPNNSWPQQPLFEIDQTILRVTFWVGVAVVIVWLVAWMIWFRIENYNEYRKRKR